MAFVIIGVAQARASCWAITPQIRTDLRVYVIASKACDQQQAGESSVTQPPQLRLLRHAHNPAFFGGMALLYYCLHEPLKGVFKFARQGAHQGDALAEDYLGNVYSSGFPGLPAMPHKAFLWNIRSAQQGFPFGEFDVGLDFFKGIGVRADASPGAFWMSKAAHAGVIQAMDEMGVLYWKGVGVPTNDAKARKWFALAAAHGDTEARQWIASHPANGAPPHATAVTAPQPAPPPAPAAVTTSVADNQQTLQNLQRFWTLYFQASNAHVVDFGEPALVRPVRFGNPP
ncbi:tetratricopeptide repeat protein [Metallibacterium sp.]